MRVRAREGGREREREREGGGGGGGKEGESMNCSSYEAISGRSYVSYS